jgi:hypothetical protein
MVPGPLAALDRGAGSTRVIRGAFDIVDPLPAHRIDTPAFYLCA